MLFSIAGPRLAASNEYAVSRDGQRFLTIEGDREFSDTAVVVLNWANGLPKR